MTKRKSGRPPGVQRSSNERAQESHVRPPSRRSLGVATIVAVAGSLGIDAALAAVATAMFPTLRNYGHFQLGDYGLLTVIGVVLACLSWPLVLRIVDEPRRAYFRLAVTVTVLLWLPDAWLLFRHQPVGAVLVLMAMHLGIAVVTYNAVVHLAPGERLTPRTGSAEGHPAVGLAVEHRQPSLAGAVGRLQISRWGWPVMFGLVLVDLLLGLIALFLVPEKRPSGLIPHRGAAIYLAHGVLGPLLFVGALVMLVIGLRSGRSMLKALSIAGFIGISIGGFGGLLVADRSLRLGGIGAMFVGALVAGLAYLAGAVEPDPQPVAATERSPAIGRDE